MSHITNVLCDCTDIYFFNTKKKSNQEISLNQKNFFFDLTAMHKVVWFKDIFLKLKNVFAGCTKNICM